MAAGRVPAHPVARLQGRHALTAAAQPLAAGDIDVLAEYLSSLE